MKPIKTQIVYICPETGKKCKSQAEAERSAENAIKARELALFAAEQQKLKEQANLQNKDYVRLNLTNIKDIPSLIKEKAKEFWNIDCNIEVYVNFGQVSNSHGAPIGKQTNWSGKNNVYPTSFLGWSGRITGNLYNYKKNPKSSESVNSVLFNNYTGGIGFRGFHTSSGCPGDVEGKYPMDIGFYFFLEDFPKLVESYELFKIEYQKIVDHKNNVSNLSVAAHHYANSQLNVNNIKQQIFDLEQQLENLIGNHKKQYKLDNAITEPIVHPNIESLKTIFKSYSGYGEFKNSDYNY
jgi:hypothetical protein